MRHAARFFFQVPPFPGTRDRDIVTAPGRSPASVDKNISAKSLVRALRDKRVGGQFWSDDDVWSDSSSRQVIRAKGDDPRLLLGAIAGRALSSLSPGQFSVLEAEKPGSEALETAIEELVEHHLLRGVNYVDPFNGSPISAIALIDVLGSWRRLIDTNRPIAAAFGFARWKRDTVAPLLWGGRAVPFRPARASELAALPKGATVAVWKARVPSSFLQQLEAGPWQIMEVEDGFIRSAGLGADCVPPLSIVVDDLGVHYDRTRPSRLEEMLARRDHRPEDLARASHLREWIIQSGISKYGVSSAVPAARIGGSRRHILVVGQVEDDRSVLFGSGEVRSNLELLKRVRAQAPDAWIIYRPHPDVEAGHRKGAIPIQVARGFADQIEPATPIQGLISLADEVHVMTSLAGFEALLQGKTVTTYGTPFFAGWGLTRDLAPVPVRRGTPLTLDELTSTVLLRYPRYLDPVTNLPCTAETLVTRLLSGVQRQNRAIVPLRRLAGWARRSVAQLAGTR
jgi:Capsule polysaccharide export protein